MFHEAVWAVSFWTEDHKYLEETWQGFLIDCMCRGKAEEYKKNMIFRWTYPLFCGWLGSSKIWVVVLLFPLRKWCNVVSREGGLH